MKTLSAGSESVYGYSKNGVHQAGGFDSIVEVVEYIEQNEGNI